MNNRVNIHTAMMPRQMPDGTFRLYSTIHPPECAFTKAVMERSDFGVKCNCGAKEIVSPIPEGFESSVFVKDMDPAEAGAFSEYMLQTKIAEAYLRIAYPSVHKTIHDDINHPAFRTALEWAEWFITSSRLVLGSRTVRELFIGMIKAAQRDGQL